MYKSNLTNETYPLANNKRLSILIALFLVTSLALFFAFSYLAEAKSYTIPNQTLLAQDRSIDGTPTSNAAAPEYENGATIPVTFTVTYDGGQPPTVVRLHYKFDSGSWVSTTYTSTNTTGTFNFVPSDGQGSYYFQTIAKDSAGHTESGPTGSGDAKTVYDTTSPTSGASSPAYAHGSTIGVDFTSSDVSGSGIAKVQLYYRFNSGTWTLSTYSSTASSGTFLFAPGDGNGTYNFQSIATDNAGNVEAGPSGSGDDSTLYDNTAPTSNATSVQYTKTSPIGVNFSASDTGGSGLQSVQLHYRFESGGWQSTAYTSSSASGTFNFTPPDGDGDYYFQTIATDYAGNVESGPTGDGDTVTAYDTTAPTSSAASPTTSQTSQFTVDFFASDATSGVDETCLWVKFNGNPWGNTNQCASGTSGDFTFNAYGEGTYCFQTIAVDNAGNSEAAASGIGDDCTQYDETAPVSAATSPTYENGATIPVDWATTDNVSGPDETCLWYKVDAGSWTDAGLCQSGSSGSFDFSPSGGNATYCFQTVATDNAGNTEAGPSGSGDDCTAYDTQKPTSSAASPDFENDPTIAVGWTASDAFPGLDQTCLWYKPPDGSWTDSAMCQAGASGSFDFDPDDGDGTYCFQTIAADKAGNTEVGPSGAGDDCTVYDTTAPNSAATSPLYETETTIPVDWATSDSDAGPDVTCFWYKPPSGSWTNSGICQTGINGSFNFTPVDGDGNYCFQTVATDNAGNAETAPSAGDGDDCTTYDTVAPASSASSPDTENSSPIQVDWTTIDATSGPDETCLWYKPPSGAWTDASLCQTGGSGSFDFDPVNGDGAYCFQTVATDNAGNSEAGASGDGDDCTVYDTTNPTASIDSPADQDTIRTLSFQVDWSAVDPAPGSGIGSYQVQYAADGGPWTDWYASTSLTSALFGPNTPVVVQYDHTYAFRVRATDAAGNQGAYGDIVTITVAKYKNYLPLVVNNYTNFTNGGFEQNWDGWSHGGQMAQSISSVDKHSGSSSALLGSPSYACLQVPAGKAWMQQTFTVPSSGVSKLRIWYRIYSQDEYNPANPTAFDRFEIYVNGVLKHRDGDDDETYGCNNLHIGNWLYHDIDLAAYLGQNITLRMENLSYPDEGKGFAIYNTWVYVDDVQLLP